MLGLFGRAAYCYQSLSGRALPHDIMRVHIILSESKLSPAITSVHSDHTIMLMPYHIHPSRGARTLTSIPNRFFRKQGTINLASGYIFTLNNMLTF